MASNAVSMSSSMLKKGSLVRSDSKKGFGMDGRLGTTGVGCTTRSQSRKLLLTDPRTDTTATGSGSRITTRNSQVSSIQDRKEVAAASNTNTTATRSSTSTASRTYLRQRSQEAPVVGVVDALKRSHNQLKRSQSFGAGIKRKSVDTDAQPGPSSSINKSSKVTVRLADSPEVLSKKEVKPESTATAMENIEAMEMEVDEIDPNALIFYESKGNCGYCGVALNEMEGVILQSCFHIYCRDCLVSSIELQDTVEIICPQGCGGRLLEKEIKALCTREVYRKWEERGMKAVKAALGGCAAECYWPGCNGWAEMDNIESRRIFVCPSCGKQNCLKCKAVHDGVSCEEYDQLKAKAAATGESVTKLLEMQEGRDWGFSQVRNQLARSGTRQSLGTFLNKEVLSTEAEIECSICFGNIPAGDGIILHECFHTFCNACIVDLVRHSDTPEVKCPYIDANFTCTCFLSPREIKTLAPPDVYEGWLEKSVKLAEGAIANSVHCKTIDCPGWVEVENVENANGAFTCMVCEKTNCLQCKAIHEGISCDDYKNRLVQNENDKKSEDALNSMVAKGECMRCPKCKTLVQKTVGCDWLLCTCCRTELCWATKGPRWGPKGKGDTSGGCGCLFYKTGGKKCAPHCQNCH